MPHFRHHSGRPPDALIFTQDLDNPQPRLDTKKRSFWRHMACPLFFLKFWQNPGQYSAVWEAVFRTLIAASYRRLALGLVPDVMFGGDFALSYRWCALGVVGTPLLEGRP